VTRQEQASNDERRSTIILVYDRGGNINVLTGRRTHGTSGRAAPFEKSKKATERAPE
jgi:hypothetical protein